MIDAAITVSWTRKRRSFASEGDGDDGLALLLFAISQSEIEGHVCD
jgi:hypothetical protein